MKTSTTGRQLIESFEGLILSAYDDANDRVVKDGQKPIGVLTIGYGHTDAAGPPKVTVGQTITKDQADQILASDLAGVEKDLNRLIKVTVNQNQYDALSSFHFNTGALGRSSVLRKLNAGDYEGAANALLLYNMAQGKVLPGLQRRREAEKKLFLTPVSTLGAEHGTAGAVIAGGATAATQIHGGHWTMYAIIAGTVVLALASYFLIKNLKEINNE